MTQREDRSRRPARVMRIIARLNIGGPAIHVALVTAGLNNADFVSTLVTGQISPTEGDMTYFARERGVEPIVIPDLGREISVVSDLRTLVALIRLIRRERPDIVHTHTAKAGLLGRLAAWLCGVPIIVHTFHGHVFHGYFGRVKTSLFIVLEQIVGLFTTAILTVSDKLRDELIQYRIAPAEKIKVISLGLDLAPIASAPRGSGGLRRSLGLDDSTPLVGIVGRLVPIKNHALFLSAAAQVAGAMPDTHFVIVGDGELRGDLERQAGALGLSDKARFMGWRRDLPAIYADLDVVALTSRNEGTPVSLIEAMSSGASVVATAVGGVPDILQNGALGKLVGSDDAAGLAQAIIALLNHPDQQQLSDARDWALSHFGAERLIADLRALYSTLLSERKGKTKIPPR